MNNETNNECWAMASEKYCATVVSNVTEVLGKKGLGLPSKCTTSLVHSYKSEIDATQELKAYKLQYY